MNPPAHTKSRSAFGCSAKRRCDRPTRDWFVTCHALTLCPRIQPVHGKRTATVTKQERENTMRKVLLSMALAVVAPFAWGQVSETTTSTTTTEGNGTITEYTPGNAIVLRETSGPRRYRFGKTVTYVTRSGRTLDEDTVRTKVKVGVPVRVHYVGTGDNMLVDRVILDED